MTIAKSSTRQRRRTTAENLPRQITSWFAGDPRGPEQSSAPFFAMAYPGYMLLREYWQVWAAAHPGARPPARYEWIAEPPPERMHGVPWAQALKAAQKCAARPRK